MLGLDENQPLLSACYLASNSVRGRYLTYAYSFDLRKGGVIVISNFKEKETEVEKELIGAPG